MIRIALRSVLAAALAGGCASSAAMPEPKMVVEVETIRCYILQAPTFENGSSALADGWRPYVVDDLAAAMKNDPKNFVLVNVEGHAASDEQDPVALSTARAKSVYDTLVAAGVDPQRLRVRGYGAYCPWSEEAEKNRRVAIRVVRTSHGDSGAELGCAAATRAGLAPD